MGGGGHDCFGNRSMGGEGDEGKKGEKAKANMYGYGESTEEEGGNTDKQGKREDNDET